jgi:dCMP deaminase
MERPTNDVTQMAIASLWAEHSTCSRAQVGAVISLNGRTIATGYNGAPPGVPHCNHDLDFTPSIHSPDRWTRRATPLPPHTTELGCRISTHAEANTIAYAARHGVSVLAGTLFVTLSPCFSCAQLVIAAGLIRVVYDRPYRDPEGINFLISSGITVESFNGYEKTR